MESPQVASELNAMGGDLNDQYQRLEVIGEGVYGTVYKAYMRTTGEVVALKRIHLEDDLDDGIPAHVIREVSLLRDFQHPNIVQLRDMTIESTQDFHLVFEYIDTDLHRILRSLRSRDERMQMNLVQSYASQLLNGIHACHSRRIIHRDLKPQNILINQKGLKIADFGLARIFSVPIKTYTHDVVTLWYRAPEILLGSPRYGPPVDMWSAGCIIAEMAAGVPTFPGDSEIGTIFKIFKVCGTPSEETWPQLRQLELFKDSFPMWAHTGLSSIRERRTELGEPGMDLLKGLISCAPNARFSSRRAKEMPFVAGMDEELMMPKEEELRQGPPKDVNGFRGGYAGNVNNENHHDKDMPMPVAAPATADLSDNHGAADLCDGKDKPAFV